MPKTIISTKSINIQCIQASRHPTSSKKEIAAADSVAYNLVCHSIISLGLFMISAGYLKRKTVLSFSKNVCFSMWRSRPVSVSRGWCGRCQVAPCRRSLLWAACMHNKLQGALALESIAHRLSYCSVPHPTVPFILYNT